MILSPSIRLLSVTLLVVPLVTIEAARSIYAIREPHIESIKKGKEICNYYNKDWFPCFDSPYFSAHCIFSPITVYSIVTAVRLKFINKNSKPNFETYTATDSNVQQNTKFDSRATKLCDIYGKPWLELIDDLITHSLVLRFRRPELGFKKPFGQPSTNKPVPDLAVSSCNLIYF
jgi:hypothetical protein